MSTPDEMGLTPNAALGYEQFFVPAIFHQWPAKIISAAAIKGNDDVLDVGCGTGALTREVVKCADSMAWPFTMGDIGKLEDIFNVDGLSDISITAHDGYAEFPSVEDLVGVEIQAWLLADSVSTAQITEIAAKLRRKYSDFANSDGPIRFPLNAFIVRAVSG